MLKNLDCFLWFSPHQGNHIFFWKLSPSAAEHIPSHEVLQTYLFTAVTDNQCNIASIINLFLYVMLSIVILSIRENQNRLSAVIEWRYNLDRSSIIHSNIFTGGYVESGLINCSSLLLRRCCKYDTSACEGCFDNGIVGCFGSIDCMVRRLDLKRNVTLVNHFKSLDLSFSDIVKISPTDVPVPIEAPHTTKRICPILTADKTKVAIASLIAAKAIAVS